MKQQHIAFIGGGNMAGSLIAGLVADGYSPANLMVSEPDSERLGALTERYRISPAESNLQAASQADILVLCVKPQIARRVCEEIAPALRAHRPLVISIMAGISLGLLGSWLGNGLALVRTMPNTPAMLQAGATALFASPEVGPVQRDQAESILRSVGLTRWVDQEDRMDAVTALSGSGPAYFFLLMEIMEQAGIDLGLDPETARLLTIQTALGAARMAMESSEAPQRLRERVTSPGGTTERAIAKLEAGGVRDLVGSALRSARDRSVELSRMLAANHG